MHAFVPCFRDCNFCRCKSFNLLGIMVLPRYYCDQEHAMLNTNPKLLFAFLCLLVVGSLSF